MNDNDNNIMCKTTIILHILILVIYLGTSLIKAPFYKQNRPYYQNCWPIAANNPDQLTGIEMY